MKDMLKGLKGRPQGFTLLEVMVALAIISTSLIVLLHSQNANISRSYHADSLALAALMAQKIVSESETNSLSIGKWEGEEVSGDIAFSWTKAVEPSMVEGLMKLSVLISWGDGKTLKLETYRIG